MSEHHLQSHILCVAHCSQSSSFCQFGQKNLQVLSILINDYTQNAIPKVLQIPKQCWQLHKEDNPSTNMNKTAVAIKLCNKHKDTIINKQMAYLLRCHPVISPGTCWTLLMPRRSLSQCLHHLTLPKRIRWQITLFSLHVNTGYNSNG